MTDLLTHNMILSETLHLLYIKLKATDDRGFRTCLGDKFIVHKIGGRFSIPDIDFKMSIDDFSNLHLEYISKILARKIQVININPIFIAEKFIDDKNIYRASYNGVILQLSKDYTFTTYIM